MQRSRPRPARSTSPPPTRPTAKAPTAPSGGAQPAAFQAASADGSEVFFTSPEKLTNDANTGPEQALAAIERDNLAGGPVETPGFIAPQRAIGVAADATHIYWADPQLGTIGRADLDGANKDPAFIAPGTTKCEVKGEPGIFEDVESHPRYVAVDAEHVYWTNTGAAAMNSGLSDGDRDDRRGQASTAPRSASNRNSSPAPPTRRGSRSTRRTSTGPMRARPVNSARSPGRRSTAAKSSQFFNVADVQRDKLHGSGAEPQPRLLRRQ